MKVTILGCGASGGVPLITGDWGNCNPENPKNRRRRSSVLVELQGKRILIDTTPDLRLQLLDNSVSTIDLVLYTHTHFDHCCGIDDLRQIALREKKRIPFFIHSVHFDELKRAFSYTFEEKDPLYPPFLKAHVFSDFAPFEWEGIKIHPFLQHHGHQISIGYRIEDFAYSTDMKDLPPESIQLLHNLSLWIVDCIQLEPHVTHSHLENTLSLIHQLQPKEAILTHMTQRLDYDYLTSLLPKGVSVGYDNRILEI